MFKHKKKIVLILTILLYLGVFFYQSNKSLPQGISIASKDYLVQEDDIEFLYDLTYVNQEGERVSEQEIFPAIFELIRGAEEYILIDMFLFNSFMAASTDEPYRQLAEELSDELIRKKQDKPEIKIDFITDPLNIVYGGAKHNQIEELKTANVNVVITDLTKLRDSNPLYSSLWRMLFRWFGNSEGGFIKHPFSSTKNKVSLRSYLNLVNFKANHRKVVVADSSDEYQTIITSANPHDGSSAHSNVACKIRGDFWQSVYSAEQAVARMSGYDLQKPEQEEKNAEQADGIKVRLLTEKKIKLNLLEHINKTRSKDEIDMAMFYLSDFDIVDSLISAAKQGVQIRLILDPNKDAFGYEKNGVPNRSVADMLTKSSSNIKIRWYSTHGEQFHSKLTIVNYKNGQIYACLGSANLTRRNLDDLNLEMNVSIVADKSTKLIQEVEEYFDKLWLNQEQNYTLDYSTFEDTSFRKKLMYKLQEKTGLSSF
jgi:phosphatidylserine/phosphatidylglycerophosphate/cardiolipin synthase-like enzyme